MTGLQNDPIVCCRPSDLIELNEKVIFTIHNPRWNNFPPNYRIFFIPPHLLSFNRHSRLKPIILSIALKSKLKSFLLRKYQPNLI